MAKVINPEFPHRCEVRRILKISPFSDQREEELIYEGVCRREASKNIRTFSKGTSSVGQQVTVDYRVSIPGVFPIHKGDIVSVDYGIGESENGIITQPNPSNLITDKYPNGRTEFYYSQPEV